MKYETENINKIKVQPVLTNEKVYTEKNLKGYKIYPRPYFNCFIAAKKFSGKSVLANSLIKKTTDKRTTLWIFCPTANLDATYKKMISEYRKSGYTVNVFNNIIEGEGRHKINHLKIILETLEEEESDEEEEVKAPIRKKEKKAFSIFETKNILKFDDDDLVPVEEDVPVKQKEQEFVEEELKEKKKRKPKKDVARHFFLFDDVSDQLRRGNFLAVFLKKNRHFKCNVCICSQAIKDIDQNCLGNLDMCLVFKGHSTSRMEHLHQCFDLTLPKETFLDLYQEITKPKYAFLYIDIRREQYRQNFNRVVKL